MDSEKTKKLGFAEVAFITLVGCLIFALNNGVRVNYGLISSAIVESSGIAPTDVSFSIAIAQLLYGLAQPVFGVLALKRSNSLALIVGAAMLLCGFAAISLCSAAWMLYIAVGVFIGGGTGAMAFGIVMSAVTPVIGERRAALVSGIINGAGGIGGAVLAPVSQLLVDIGGLRLLMTGLASLSALIIIASVWLLGKESKAAVQTAAEEEMPKFSVIITEALKSRNFLHIAMAFFTCGFFMAIIETQLYSQILSLGFSGATAAFAFTVYGIMGMLGPVAAGLLCVKLKCKWVLGTFYALRPAAVIAFILLPKTKLAVYVFIIALGLIGNSTVPPTTNLLSKLYGFKKLGMLSGIAFVFHQIGSFISTWLGGAIISSTGSYTLVWLIGAAFAASAAILSYTVKE